MESRKILWQVLSIAPIAEMPCSAALISKQDNLHPLSAPLISVRRFLPPFIWWKEKFWKPSPCGWSSMNRHGKRNPPRMYSPQKSWHWNTPLPIWSRSCKVCNPSLKRFLNFWKREFIPPKYSPPEIKLCLKKWQKSDPQSKKRRQSFPSWKQQEKIKFPWFLKSKIFWIPMKRLPLQKRISF